MRCHRGTLNSWPTREDFIEPEYANFVLIFKWDICPFYSLRKRYTGAKRINIWGAMPRNVPNVCDPFYEHGLTLILAWISNYIHYKEWDKIIYPFLNFNGATVEV